MGIEIKGKLLGADAVIKKMLQAGKDSERAVIAALYQAGFLVDANAARRVPVDNGFLRASHYVAPPTGIFSEVEIGFGVEYAAEVHERPLRNPTTEGTEDHFLENALNAVLSTKLIADLAEQNLKAGIGVESIPKDAPSEPKHTGNPGKGKK